MKVERVEFPVPKNNLSSESFAKGDYQLPVPHVATMQLRKIEKLQVSVQSLLDAFLLRRQSNPVEYWL